MAYAPLLAPKRKVPVCTFSHLNVQETGSLINSNLSFQTCIFMITTFCRNARPTNHPRTDLKWDIEPRHILHWIMQKAGLVEPSTSCQFSAAHWHDRWYLYKNKEQEQTFRVVDHVFFTHCGQATFPSDAINDNRTIHSNKRFSWNT